ncbi:hypothetical protein MGYG_02590 [Nannizzia gypsea CBS 118893]|uniref:CHAT domain-containing protein n=1 Tax=Arthroderma gypseum (strain ATCC MYA-4604 / CBS 118893) TaxID=535722 RepID=E4UNB7_ARTGP|nr:hypothetical protein MGYG_02590 [Nannizzia gypsea CBS 118893]EFQ99578.1 hypothetical protein MGYG_02590 [Nannizzia gypsea CBS 118893]
MDDDPETFLLKNFEHTLSLVPSNDNSVRSELCMYYAILKHQLFQRHGQVKDLKEAIKQGRNAIYETPKDCDENAERLDIFADMLESQYYHTKKVKDLEELIRVARQAVDITQKGHKDLTGRLDKLGSRLSLRYERTGKIEDLEEVIQMTRKAINIIPKNHLADWLSKLGSNLAFRYKHAGKMEDIIEAIRATRQAIDITPKDHSDIEVMLTTLGNNLMLQYECTGKIEDLDEAIQIARRVVNIIPKDSPHRAASLSNLGGTIGKRYTCLGMIEDLEEAIQVGRQAVAVTPKDSPDLSTFLNNLGMCLGFRYERTGKLEDLEEAIQIGRQAVNTTPKGHLNLTILLSNLGNNLGSRYRRMGQWKDLEDAIRVAQQAVNITPENHADLAGRLSNLGGYFELRYERTRKIEDLKRAIQIGWRAVDVTSKDHSYFAAWLNNLGSRLYIQHNHTGKLEKLEEAISITRQAVDITPKNHPDLAIRLNNLGNRLERQYECTGETETLEEAIQVARQAVDITPKDHPDLAIKLNCLGSKLGFRYERTGKMEDLEEAIHVTQHAWKCENATPFVRIEACIQALRLLRRQENFESAYRLSVEAIRLLSYVHHRSLSPQDQQFVVSHFSGLATTACSLALKIGKEPAAALEILEQGRGVIHRLLMDDRSNISDLKIAHPELCAEYERLLFEINKSIANNTDNQTRMAALASRVKAVAKLETCIRDIQQLPGFSHFHKALTAKQMQSCSTAGSIVVINITDLGSDAIIVTVDTVRVLPLPGLSAGQARDWINQDLTTTTLSDRGRKNKRYLEFLSWLWRGCVRPVLEELHCEVQSSADDLPRVWWIGTGLANSFPFHSAGDVSAGKTENACYRVISSYTSTIRALQYARERTSKSPSIPSGRDPWRVVIVTMPETPDANDLPGTRRERSEIIAAMGSSTSIVSLEYPDAASAMAQLRECSIAHFACHGVSDSRDPSRSGLILQTARTASKQPRQDVLSVREVSQARLSRAEIVYLSACSTAQNRALKLSDEVLHVVSGFQVAGFRHVVGCLWPSDDTVCVEVTKLFYSELGRAGATWYGTDRSPALALHKSLVKIRESREYCKRPLLWAQYVHFGA